MFELTEHLLVVNKLTDEFGNKLQMILSSWAGRLVGLSFSVCASRLKKGSVTQYLISLGLMIW